MLALIAVDQNGMVALIENRGKRGRDGFLGDCVSEGDLLCTNGSLLPGIPNWKKVMPFSSRNWIFCSG